MFFSRKENEIIFDHFSNFPGFLDSLILLELLFKDHSEKMGDGQESCLPDSLRIKVHQQKRRMDNFYAHYNGKPVKMLSDIEGKLSERVKTTNELNLRSLAEAENILGRSTTLKIPINHNKQKHQQEIAMLRMKEDELKYKISNFVDISKIYGRSEESFYIRCINSQIFSRIVNESHLKGIIARLLTKMDLTYQQDYCDFPFVADFLITSKEHGKVVIQVIY